MKDEQKVFIRGVEGREEEIANALRDHGGEIMHSICGSVSSMIFYITHNGCIDGKSTETEIAKIIMDNYTELLLPEQWRDGDLLVSYSTGAGKLYAVYDDDSEFMDYSIIAYVYVDIDTCDVNAAFSKDRFKLASDEEHKEFRELLHKHGKDWDAEKKQLVDWKWKPKDMEEYWFFTGSNTIIRSVWKDTLLDNKYFDFGNCFQTKKEAEAAAERVRKALKGE